MFGAMTVTVIHVVDGATDAHGVPVKSEEIEHVSNVSVRPETTATLIDGKAHEYMVETSLALAFPKTYEGDLRGAFIEAPMYPGKRFAVQGDPLPTYDAPTEWNRNVRAVLCDG